MARRAEISHFSGNPNAIPPLDRRNSARYKRPVKNLDSPEQIDMNAEPYSNKIDIFNRHRHLFRDLIASPDEKAIQIGHADWIDINLLREMADKLSQKNVQYVVTLWAEGIELRRMDTVIDRSLFYNFVQPTSTLVKDKSKEDEIVEVFKKAIDEYLSKDLQKARTYCGYVTEEMRLDKVIPRSWLTLRLNGNKIVKSLGVEKFFTILETLGYIENVDGKALYGKGAKMYIIKMEKELNQ